MNSTTVNSTSITDCETPANATNCPYLKKVNAGDSFLTCVSACLATELVYTNTSFQQCITSCPAAAQYIQVDGATCGTTCASGFFSYNVSRSNPQCLASCAFPLTKIANATYGGYYDCETTCQTATGISNLFLNRADQTCIGSCLYQNVSSISGTTY